ncbi:DUF6731 family protein [Aliidiomarina haloalkalitolerans]|uniref:DUF4747 domain-containing protein n=1 Tax=Aliidiomarina haloalkalitolerans TaxID=859059 RepID=A0A432VRR8_9GAMM|nr:DUF6731 family protein [Aliidiomarina haloalkalitolerans]RUO18919.1 hypothetical protein CWE06_10015 [Aliidiomarina haloalkalitolerans]
MINPNEKTITFDFYSIGLAAESQFDFFGFLNAIVQRGGYGQAWEDGPYAYELRDVAVVNGIVRGEFAKFRRNLLPHIGQPGGAERQIDLQEKEALIEKNYFSYRPADNLLTYQLNGHASREAKFAEYLSTVVGEAIVFNPLIQANAIQRLLTGQLTPTALHLTFSRPTNREMYPEDEFGCRLLDLLDEVGGANISLKITSHKTAADVERRSLEERAKSFASAFARSPIIRTAKVTAVRDGVDHPIDLIADRIRSRQNVAMGSRYPIRTAVFAAMEAAFVEQRDALYEVIGEPGNRID